MPDALEKLIENIKPVVFEIIEESGTIIPNFLEKRIAEKYIRATLLTLIAKHGHQISVGIDSVLPMAKQLFKEEYYKGILELQDIVLTPIGQFGSRAAINARNQSKSSSILK